MSHAECVNSQGTKLDGINVPKYGSMVTKYFSSHKMKRKVYATILYHYLWMTMLACEQLRAYFLCHNYVPVFYHKSRLYSWLTQHFSKSRGMFHPLGTAQNFNIQFVVSLPWNTITTKITRTPVFWRYIWTGSGEHCWRYRADTILSTDGLTDNWTDRQRDKEKPVHTPIQLRWIGGYNDIQIVLPSTSSPVLMVKNDADYYICVCVRVYKYYTTNLGQGC